MPMSARRAVAAAFVLALAGAAGCYNGNRNQVPSWEPPVAAQLRIERVREQANAAKPQARAPGSAVPRG